MNTHEELRRFTITITITDDPHVETLAVEALLRLVEWLQHEAITPTSTTLQIT